MIARQRLSRPWVWAGVALIACGSAHAGEPRWNSPEAYAQYHIMVGELAALRQQPALAAQELLKALDKVPDAEIAHQAAGFAVAAHDEPLALKAAKRWQQLDPGSPEARQVVALLSLRAGKRDDVVAQCEAMIHSDPGGPEEGFRDVALLLSKDSAHKDDALAIMDTLVKKYSSLAGAFYAQSLLSMRFNELGMAERAARESLRLKNGRESQLLLTGVLVRKGDIAGADASMAEVLKDGDKTAELRLSYARLLLEANHPDDARKQFEAVLKEHPDNGDARLALGLLALEREDYDGAEAQFKGLLKQPALKPQAAYYLGRIEESRNKPAAALEWYKQVDQGDSAIDAGIRRAIVLGKLGKVEEGRRLLGAMRDQLPMFADRFYSAEGELLLDANKPEQALAMYQEALDESPDDSELLYGRSLVHERMDHVPLAEADLRRILEVGKEDHDPEKEARALNALGYMLTVHTDRLGEARKLISRAMELTPDDPAVIDSMGWVEYKMGNVKDARNLLEKAFDKLKDPEIAAHLGEVLWTEGDKDRARAVWNQGLGKDPSHRVLRDTVNRLTNK